MKNLFIGIDFSKKKFDVSVVDKKNVEVSVHQIFENNTAGCKALIVWLKEQTTRSVQEWLFCGEHTGIYSVTLSEFLARRHFSLWLENPLQIKRSMGIKREKNDKADSLAIASYALRFADKAREFQLPEDTLVSLSMLLSFRDRLVRSKQVLLVAAAELRAVRQRNKDARYIYEQSQQEVEHLNKQIKEVEKKMNALLQSSDTLKENYELVTSIKGIALINAVAILVHTNNFTAFNDARQFACYAGVAPFGHQSGSSIHGTPHVSHLANKQIKSLLSSAARSAVRHDANLRQYYERKIAEGKKDFVVINNVRNKLIHRIFAVVRNKQPYQVNYYNLLDKTA
ncbi:IS110 family transposase [Bacteroidia bacterium]|nr:IS110 family transposase [Bacteroidia bacterium]